MRSLALGVLILLVGAAFTLAASPLLHWSGWTAVALGAVIAVVDLAVGPTMRRTRGA